MVTSSITFNYFIGLYTCRWLFKHPKLKPMLNFYFRYKDRMVKKNGRNICNTALL